MSDDASEAVILDLSNRFYTLIPHDFGMKKPPLLSNLDYIQVRRRKRESLQPGFLQSLVCKRAGKCGVVV